MGFTFEQVTDWNALLAYIGGGISLFFNSLLLLFYLSIPEVRTFFVKLLFYLSICDWFASLSIFLIGSETNETLCEIQAGFQQFFSLSSIFWMSAISFTMFMTVTKHKQYMWKYELLYHILIWPLPVITTVIIYAVNVRITYSDIYAWCWIDTHLWLSPVIFYVPLLFTLFIITYFYSRTIFYLAYNEIEYEEHYDRYKKLQHSLTIFLIATILCRIWAVIVLFQMAFSPHIDQYILLIYSFFAPLQAFVNTFLFFNSSIRKRISQSNLCLKWFSLNNSPEFQPLIHHQNGNPTSGGLAALISPIFHTETSWLYPDSDTLENYDYHLNRNENQHKLLHAVNENMEIEKSAQVAMLADDPNNNLKLQQIHKKESKKRIIELEESKFESEIIEEYNIFITTFNMAAYSGATPTLLDWMKVEFAKVCDSDIDIYVFGAQEMALDSRTFGTMLRSLVGANKYVVLTHKRLSGIYIGILVKSDISREVIKDIKVKATRTGIGNLYGNKGAVGVSFRIHRTSFCFINAHLAANRTSKCLQDRIEDLVLIVQGLGLGDQQIDFTHQFHAMYLLGDLNFRIGGDFTSDKVVNMIENNEYDTLKLNDELNTLRKPNTFEEKLLSKTLSYDETYNASRSYFTGDDEWDDIADEMMQQSEDENDEKATKTNQKNKKKTKNVLNLEHMLQSFVEGAITFAPTYKFEVGCNQYTNKRVPAWCDRILWVKPPHPCINITQLYYTCSSITPPISDHRPVFSEFHITYNKSWNPSNNSQWSVSITNFFLYLYGHSTIHQPYLTIHSPLLQTCMRTQMGQTITSQSSYSASSSSSNSCSDLNAANAIKIPSLLCYKFQRKQFVIKCIDSNLGNGCLWIVVRDDNLLGDVDVIGASVIPLVDTENNNVYVHFKRDVTFATAKKGYIEGQMKCTEIVKITNAEPYVSK